MGNPLKLESRAMKQAIQFQESRVMAAIPADPLMGAIDKKMQTNIRDNAVLSVRDVKSVS